MSDETSRERAERLRVENEMRTCRHFNGTQHATCKAGVRYADVRDPEGRIGVREPYPCLRFETRQTKPGADCAVKCEKREFRTREEVEQREATMRAHVDAFVQKFNDGKVCPHCDTPIETRKKVGRCMYVLPCGHRLGQVG